jgi:hypothetical protein
MGFFTKQRYDYAGMLAVRLQKFIIFLFVRRTSAIKPWFNHPN